MTSTPTTSSEYAAVTVLGLGPMGRALADAFFENGHPTTIWNRTPGKGDALVERGATLAATPAEAAAASPLVIVCVIDADAVQAVVDQAAESLRGRTLVNLTTASPQCARAMASWAADRDITYLDGSIMTPTTTIGGSSAVVLYSGPREVYDAHRETLAAVGGTADHLGSDPGRAAAHDVALLDLFWTTMSGVVHAFALARTEDIAAKELLPYANGIAELLPPIMMEFAEHIENGHFPGDDSNIYSTAAGMEHIIHAARTRDLDVSVLSAAKEIVQRAIDAGYGSDGFSRLTDVLTGAGSA